VHSSKAMIISEPRLDWILMDFSASRKCQAPSAWDLKDMPSSVMRVRFSFLGLFVDLSEQSSSHAASPGNMLPILPMLCSLAKPIEKA